MYRKCRLSWICGSSTSIISHWINFVAVQIFTNMRLGQQNGKNYKKKIVSYMCPIFCLEKIVTPVFVLLHDLNSQVPPHQSGEGKKKLFTLILIHSLWYHSKQQQWLIESKYGEICPCSTKFYSIPSTAKEKQIKYPVLYFSEYTVVSLMPRYGTQMAFNISFGKKNIYLVNDTGLFCPENKRWNHWKHIRKAAYYNW